MCSTPASCADEGTSCLTMFSLAGLLTVNFPGGYCTKSMCSAGMPCPTGSACEATTMTCLKSCTSNNQCGRAAEGYTCATPPLGGGMTRYCLPPDITNLIGGGGATGGLGNLAGLFGGAGGAGAGNLAGLAGLLGGGGAAGGTRSIEE